MRWMLWACLALSTAVAADDARYQAFALPAAEGSRTGSRAFILDGRDGHVWIWSENELVTAPDGSRRYGAGFVYQGRLRPGGKPGEMIDPAR